MKTIIYVSGTDKVQDRRRLFGLTEYATRHGWNLQTVEAMQSPQQVKELMRIWKPDGIIVCRGAALNDLSAKSFGKTPVLFSHNPGTRKVPMENCIFSDANAVVELAAKELLSLNLSAYAFVGWFKPIGWCTQRRSAFESFMQMHGRRIHIFEPSEHKCSSNTITAHLADWLSTIPRPLGVLTANDQIAQRIVSACHLARLDVPDDVAVMGILQERLLTDLCRNLTRNQGISCILLCVLCGENRPGDSADMTETCPERWNAYAKRPATG